MADTVAIPDASRIAGLAFRGFGGPQDLAGMAAVRAVCGAYDQVDPLSVAQSVPTEADLARTMVPSEKFDPGQDVLLATIAGRIIGYSHVIWWTEADGTWLHLLLGWVVPEWRQHGIGTAMLHWAEARGRTLAAGHPTQGKAFFGANASDTERDSTALLLNEGYRARFSVLEMGFDDWAGVQEPPLPSGFVTRPLARPDLPALFASMNECYVDHPFSEALVYQEWADQQQDLSTWHVAWDEESGEMVGQVQVLLRKGLAEPEGPLQGELEEVSVGAPYRGRGLAPALIVKALLAARALGVSQVRLRTLNENPQQAWRLYEKVGFRVLKRFPRYRKPLEP